MDLRKRRLALAALTVITALLLQSLSAQAEPAVKQSTTTSTENSGLLAYLLPAYDSASGIKVRVIAVGTGMALESHHFSKRLPGEIQFILRQWKSIFHQ